MMKKLKFKRISFLLAMLAAGALTPAAAHYQMLIPTDDIVTHKERRAVDLNISFNHPFEGLGVSMEKPSQFGVWVAGQEIDLLKTLKEIQIKDRMGDVVTAYTTSYTFRKPGDHIFHVTPQPYWDEAEKFFLIQHTKVIVNAFGLEEGWDHELGLNVEIIPLTRPYGLWTGNVFQGIVKVNGAPMPFVRVAVEYYNEKGEVTAPADPFITQAVKTDANGVFTYAMPKSGWWGFAAKGEDNKTLNHKGKAYPVELGAVLWIKTYDMP